MNNFCKKFISMYKDKKVLGQLLWLYQFVQSYKRKIAIIIGLAFFCTALNMIIMIMVKDLSNAILQRDVNKLIFISFIYMALGLISIITNMIRNHYSVIVKTRFKRVKNVEVFHKILNCEWQGLYEHHSGDIISRLSNDVNDIADCIVGWIPELFSSVIKICAAFILISFYDRGILLYLVITAPIIICLSKVFIRKLFDLSENSKKIESDIISYEKEVLHNILAYKAFGCAPVIEERMLYLQEKSEQAQKDVNKYSLLSWLLLYIGGQIALIVGTGLVAYRMYLGDLTIGTMILIGIMVGYIVSGFKKVTDIIPKVISTVTSVKRVRDLIELEEEGIDKKESICSQYHSLELSVSVDNISFAYRNRSEILYNISLYGKSGEIIALVGSSGEGKTTLMRLLLGVISPTSGTISIKDNATETLEEISAQTRKYMAYVPQGNTIMMGSIAENMRLMLPEATKDDIIGALKLACAYDFVETLPNGIDHIIGENGIGFSEGQNQRLAIARALITKRPILLLDEATSALDVSTERRILTNILESKQKRLCFLTTHRENVLSICDKIYRIEHNAVREITKQDISILLNEECTPEWKDHERENICK